MTRTKRQKKLSKMRQKAKKLQTTTCPTANKIPYATRGRAENTAISMLVKGRYARVYQCPCGVFHISTKPPQGHKRLPKMKRR